MVFKKFSNEEYKLLKKAYMGGETGTLFVDENGEEFTPADLVSGNKKLPKSYKIKSVKDRIKV